MSCIATTPGEPIKSVFLGNVGLIRSGGGRKTGRTVDGQASTSGGGNATVRSEGVRRPILLEVGRLLPQVTKTRQNLGTQCSQIQ